MNKKQFTDKYFKVVKDLGAKPNEVVVSAGGALLMLGLRSETDDMDLDVPLILFQKHKTKDNSFYFGKVEYLELGDGISLHIADEKIEMIEVDGVFIYSLPELIKMKQRLLNHPERSDQKKAADRKDLEELKKLMKSNNVGKPAYLSW